MCNIQLLSGSFVRLQPYFYIFNMYGNVDIYRREFGLQDNSTSSIVLQDNSISFIDHEVFDLLLSFT